MRGHRGTVWKVAVSGDARVVVSGGTDGTVRRRHAHTGECLRILRAERGYEQLNITGLSGVTAKQREALYALGAVEHTNPVSVQRETNPGVDVSGCQQ